MKKLDEFTIIGKIINTKGIKGELKIYPITKSIDRFYDLEYVYLGESLDKLKIKKVHDYNDLVYITFEGYEDINKVLKFKDQYIYVDDEDKLELEEGEYFVDDIIGLEVVDLSGKKLGKIIDVIENPANDLYVLEGLNKNLSYIPAVSEFIKDIDFEKKILTIDPIEGLIN